MIAYRNPPILFAKVLCGIYFNIRLAADSTFLICSTFSMQHALAVSAPTLLECDLWVTGLVHSGYTGLNLEPVSQLKVPPFSTHALCSVVLYSCIVFASVTY